MTLHLQLLEHFAAPIYSEAIEFSTNHRWTNVIHVMVERLRLSYAPNYRISVVCVDFEQLATQAQTNKASKTLQVDISNRIHHA